MTKYLIAAAALVVAGIPAAFGLAGNASFTHDIPVRVPDQVQLTPVAAGDDDGTADQGHGDAPGTEPGDDHGGSTNSGSGSTNSGSGSTNSGSGSTSSGSGSSGSGTSGSGRSGSDDTTADDSGHHGGGSDDGSGHH